MAARRINEQEKERIIELRLNGVPVRSVAKQLDTTTRTVQRHWHKYLDQTAEERAGHLERIREELLQRQEQIATDARLGALRSRRNTDGPGEVRFLAEERAALREMERLTGAAAPTKTEVTGPAGGPIEIDSPHSRLDQMLHGLTQTTVTATNTTASGE